MLTVGDVSFSITLLRFFVMDDARHGGETGSTFISVSISHLMVGSLIIFTTPIGVFFILDIFFRSSSFLSYSALKAASVGTAHVLIMIRLIMRLGICC